MDVRADSHWVSITFDIRDRRPKPGDFTASAPRLSRVNTHEWNPQSWRNFTALQQPSWPADSGLEQTLKILGDQPPLVFAGEARQLMEQLGAASRGEAFLLQAGDCAESFESSADSIRDRLKVILQMAVVLTYAGGMPVHFGRVEACPVMGLKLFVLAHNTVRGAAGAAILNAELLVERGR